MSALDAFYQLAYDLAYQARAYSRPNPAVGAVVVSKAGEIIGQGHTQVSGGEHAEVQAIHSVKDKALLPTSDLFVTLEPCCHFGRTPPCTDLILKENIKRVHIALPDLDPRVSKLSLEILRKNGVEFFFDFPQDLKEKCFELNRDFYWEKIHQSVLVSGKWAMTLDGRSATASGDSKWISHEASRTHVQALRYCHDAILVSDKTAALDEARLTVRSKMKTPPLRVIIGTKQLHYPNLPIFNDEAKTIIIGSEPLSPSIKELIHLNHHEYLQVKNLSGGYDLKGIIRSLKDKYQIRSLLIEGGATLLGSFIEADLVDQLFTYIAPKLLLDKNALPALNSSLPKKMMTESKAFTFEKVQVLTDQEGQNNIFAHSLREKEKWKQLREKLFL